MIPEGTPGKYTLFATRGGKLAFRESRTTRAAAETLRAQLEKAGYEVQIVEGLRQDLDKQS